jgi:periplasmic divalent cation tolerance protein
MAWPWEFGSQRLHLVRTTVGSKQAADALAQQLIDERLAACTHVAPIASTYRWKGKTEHEEEFVVEARTTAARRAAVVDAMLKGHPYEVPLVESWPVADVPVAYMAWVNERVG